MQVLFLALLCCLPVQVTDADQDLIDGFSRLNEKRRREVIEHIETRIGEMDLPLVRLVRQLLDRPEAPSTPPPYLEGKTWFDEKKYAPRLPIKRKILPEKSRLLTRGRNRFLDKKVWYDLRDEYRYHFGKNEIYRLKKEPALEDRLRQYLLGYPPHSDLAREILLKILDTRSSWDNHADYFDHTYTDRDGNVYPGITLFDVWDSGQELECPDVDVIPYAWKILGDRSFKSPIPAGRRRTNLYRTIGLSFRDYRRYRLMIEGVAAFYLASDPPVSPFVKPLNDEVNFLIATSESDPARVAKFVTAHESSLELNKAIGGLYEEYGSGYPAVIAERKRSLEEDHTMIRDAVREELKRLLEKDG
jgi:hypothetical protein